MSDRSLSLTVTFFPNFAATTKSEKSVTLADLVRQIETTTGPAKAVLPWLKLARFGNRRTEKHSLRHDANMLAISGVEADYDDGQVSVDAAITTLGAAGILGVIYTSPSHTEDAPRWRVLCPLSQDYPPDQRERFLARLNGLFGGIFSNESWTRSQSYYFGSVNGNPSHRAALLDGTPIDLADELDGIAIAKPEKAKPNGAHSGPATPPEAITDKRINGIIQALLNNIRAAADQQKHTTLWDNGLTIGGYLHLTHWSAAEAVEACMAALEGCSSPVADWNAARKTAAEAIAAGAAKPLPLTDRPQQQRARKWVPPAVPDEAPPAGDPAPAEGEPPDQPPPPEDDGRGRPVPDGLPVITCAAGELPRMVREAEAALLNAGAPIYQRGMLVQPTEQEYRDADDNVTHSGALVPVAGPTLLKLLSEVAEFQKWDGRAKAFVTCDPPDKLVQIVLHDRRDWGFPVVRGVLTCPTLRPDGSLLVTAGYDPISRYYLMFPSGLVLPDITAMPSIDDARDALTRLDRLLDSYPFVNPPSRSVALCLLMTQVLRCAMPVSPLLAVSAKAPGTGKSHLVDLASTIAIGRACPSMGAGKDDKETEKEINTMLLSGVPGFSIDNVHRDLDTPVLNRATSQTHLSIRLYGVLENVEVENAVVIFMTGNNLAIVDEQGRRTMRCDLDAGEEHPERRAFPLGDPIFDVRANRGRYIADVLTVARAYHVSNERVAPFPLGGFGAWSHFVREPLIWLGRADPAATMDTAARDDPATIRLHAVTAGWRGQFHETALTVAEAVKTANDDLYALLREHFPARAGSEVDTTRMGFWLRKYVGRVADGRRFVKEEGNTHGSIRWKVELVG